ncbi:MAG: glycosyltransferase family 2 protein [Xanthomonadaceae bacterium]|nr:glycosyltransferase family 2 protein [Xanthomonadaceae bacterium]
MSKAHRPPLSRVTVVIVNYNAGHWLQRCVESLRPRQSAKPELTIIDNGSRDGSLDFASGRPEIAIDRVGSNLGFARAINRACRGRGREYLLILNPDCLISRVDLAELINELDRHPEAALASGRVLDQNGQEQRGSRRRLPTPRRIVDELLRKSSNGIDLSQTHAPTGPIEVEAVSGACMLVRRAAFDQLGGMDERYPLHFEDLDLFARLSSAGWKLRWTPAVSVVHAGGQSSKSRPVAVLWAKHIGLWRYLVRHCPADQWPRWQRPAWALMIALSLAVKTPVTWLAGVLGPRR